MTVKVSSSAYTRARLAGPRSTSRQKTMYPLRIVVGSHDFAQSVDPMGLGVDCTGNVDRGECPLLIQQKALVDIEDPRDDRNSEEAQISPELLIPLA